MEGESPPESGGGREWSQPPGSAVSFRNSSYRSPLGIADILHRPTPALTLARPAASVKCVTPTPFRWDHQWQCAMFHLAASAQLLHCGIPL